MQDPNDDPALALSESFKKQGHLDKLKKEILAKPLNGTTFEDFIKTQVQNLVHKMVQEDESLIFKNRGSTSALLEASLFKNGYEKLDQGDISVDKFINENLQNESLKESIKNLINKEICE